MLKSTLLLATALFLISAPAPDSADMAEATHGLIADTGTSPLEAAEPSPKCDGAPESEKNDAFDAAAGCPRSIEAP